MLQKTIFIDFGSELSKKHAVEEEGCFRYVFINCEEGLNKKRAGRGGMLLQLYIRLESETCFGRGIQMFRNV